MSREHQIIFEHAIRTADVIAGMLGKFCEVAVHDFSNLDQSLIYLSGEITNRKIGSPATDLVLHEIQKKGSDADDIVNYRTTSRNGIVMKSSTVFLRDANNAIIGALCINLDISLLIRVGGEIQDFIKFEETQTNKENFYSSVNEIIEDMVENVVQTFNKVPAMLDMEEKIECVRLLDNKGAFMIKGAVEYLASVLGVSRFTIYNYLKKIRMENKYHVE